MPNTKSAIRRVRKLKTNSINRLRKSNINTIKKMETLLRQKIKQKLENTFLNSNQF